LAIRQRKLPPNHWHVGYAACALSSVIQDPARSPEKASLMQSGRESLGRALGAADLRLQQCAGPA
jgi:hypothetical protein